MTVDLVGAFMNNGHFRLGLYVGHLYPTVVWGGALAGWTGVEIFGLVGVFFMIVLEAAVWVPELVEILERSQGRRL